MRRIQVDIEEELDDRLAAEAERTGRTKAELIQESVASRFGRSEEIDDDPITRLIGTVDADPADVDEVVYGA